MASNIDTEPSSSNIRGLRKRWSSRRQPDVVHSHELCQGSVDDDDSSAVVHSPCQGSEVQFSLVSHLHESDGPSNIPLDQLSRTDAELEHETSTLAPEAQKAADTSDGSIMSGRNAANAADSYFLSNNDLKVVMPWERGPTRALFDKAVVSPQVVPKMASSWSLHASSYEPAPQANESLDVATHDAQSSSLEGPVFLRSFANISDSTFLEQVDKRRRTAACKWLMIINLRRDASVTGRQIKLADPNFDVEKTAMDIIEATLGVKSPATTAKQHADAILSLYRWSITQGISDLLPFSEPVVWEYDLYIKESNAAPTKFMTLTRALRFAHYIFRVQGASECIESGRVLGLADSLFVSKRLLKQAKPLSVAQVVKLHEICDDAKTHPVAAACAGFLLTCLYGRARQSDFYHIHSLSEDCDLEGGFVEVRTSHHKTGRSVRGKRNSCQYCCLLNQYLVTSGPWVSS